MKKIALPILLALVLVAPLVAQTTTGSPAAPATTAPAATTPAASTPTAPAVTAPAATAPAATTPEAAPAATATAAPASTGPAEGSHYLVTSALGAERSADLLSRLESLFSAYNKVFRFDEARIPGKLVVREFATKADFDAYLLKLSGETRGDFVYVHYPSAPKRELLVYSKAEPEFSSSLAHQAFIQFVKAFIQEPPLWLRDGFAVAFETLRPVEGQTEAAGAENLAWLETVKSLAKKGSLVGLDRLLAANVEETRSGVEVFYPESWAFVSFLLNAKGDYARLLWETIATMSPDASLADNQEAFIARLSSWYGLEATGQAFSDYIASRMTYPELIAAGIELYGKKELDKAAEAFAAAEELDPTNYVSPYYLGLIAYDKGEWATADNNYRIAIARGCDAATATYAIGLNSIARGLTDEGATALAQAAASNPDRYREKVEGILKLLGK